jgi:glycine cleavage system H protein
MLATPDDRRYHEAHTWAQAYGNAVTVGITDHAQDELGDIVFLQLPEIGESVQAGAAMGEIESVKTVSDLISPVSGKVLERNQAAIDKPEQINSDPYGAGWVIRAELAESTALDGLLTAQQYDALTKNS